MVAGEQLGICHLLDGCGNEGRKERDGEVVTYPPQQGGLEELCPRLQVAFVIGREEEE